VNEGDVGHKLNSFVFYKSYKAARVKAFLAA
jgi:hypothetical protein